MDFHPDKDKDKDDEGRIPFVQDKPPSYGDLKPLRPDRRDTMEMQTVPCNNEVWEWSDQSPSRPSRRTTMDTVQSRMSQVVPSCNVVRRTSLDLLHQEEEEQVNVVPSYVKNGDCQHHTTSQLSLDYVLQGDTDDDEEESGTTMFELVMQRRVSGEHNNVNARVKPNTKPSRPTRRGTMEMKTLPEDEAPKRLSLLVKKYACSDISLDSSLLLLHENENGQGLPWQVHKSDHHMMSQLTMDFDPEGAAASDRGGKLPFMQEKPPFYGDFRPHQPSRRGTMEHATVPCKQDVWEWQDQVPAQPSRRTTMDT
jgi:hypothetical protein